MTRSRFAPAAAAVLVAAALAAVPANARYRHSVELHGISCPSTTFCAAVGTYDSTATFGLVYDGTTWIRVATPRRGSGSTLAGVSCVRPDWCAAVGFVYTYFADFRIVPLVLDWDGTRWTAVRSHARGDDAELAAISCPTDDFCAAVGHFFVQSSSTSAVPLVEMFNGHTWRLASLPETTNDTQLTGVSCTSPTDCTAVGYTGARALAMTWNGSTWKRSGNLRRNAALNGVSCSAAAMCIAVGNQRSASFPGTASYVVARSGNTWTEIAAPANFDAPQTTAIACLSATSCQAVGVNTSPPIGTGSGADGYDGTAWTVEAGPVFVHGSALHDVACVASDDCFSAGAYYLSDGQYPWRKPLVEHWDGASWTQQETPTR